MQPSSQKYRLARISLPQNENAMIIYSPKCHPRCSCLPFFSGKYIFLHTMDFMCNQNVQINAVSKGSEELQTALQCTFTADEYGLI